ncbi:hypothetical protein J2W39_005920 [Variovorax paradoxus]|uniref:Uncharacterized protein n=1 Tax=Variovorax paradoxus TaxID=34073 RepID=A0AAW8EQE1_VARPD|nr:hypothetical protein [Variovorax paradoxus]MDP9974650.1 hypothetical protein [Variovorax paradoxus]
MAYLKELKVTFTRKRVDDDLLNKPVESPAQVFALFKDMQDETKEKVVVLHLNSQLEILSYKLAAIGMGSFREDGGSDAFFSDAGGETFGSSVQWQRPQNLQASKVLFPSNWSMRHCMRLDRQRQRA